MLVDGAGIEGAEAPQHQQVLLTAQSTNNSATLFAPQNYLWVEQESNLRRRKPTDLQSVPVDRFGIHPGYL